MTTTKEIKDIPESELQSVVEDFKSEGCEVEIIKQPDGNYTVKAKCPEKKSSI